LTPSQQLTSKIIGCAIEVHRHLGPGLLEATYEVALCIELADAGFKFQRKSLFRPSTNVEPSESTELT
jgi:GxxExxY protein